MRIAKAVIASALTAALAGAAAAQDGARIWSEFTAKLKAGELTAADLRPEYTTLEQQLAWLRQLKDAVDKDGSWAEMEARPKIFPVGDHVQILARFRMDGRPQTVSFAFIVEGTRWYYSHMEMISIRLDEVGPPPVSKFPDIPEERKAWIREETYWSTIIGSLYLPLAREKGAEAARQRLLDGPGYFVAVKTWVPFLPPHRAFILYLCWEQSVLRGSKVTLETLEDERAVVRMETLFFSLYKRSSHMKTWLPFAEYRGLFEAIWADRAAAAGWSVAFEYTDFDGLECVLRFERR
jgi:hypothetical protein